MKRNLRARLKHLEEFSRARQHGDVEVWIEDLTDSHFMIRSGDGQRLHRDDFENYARRTDRRIVRVEYYP